jgi:hypothetical protein
VDAAPPMIAVVLMLIVAFGVEVIWLMAKPPAS